MLSKRREGEGASACLDPDGSTGGHAPWVTSSNTPALATDGRLQSYTPRYALSTHEGVLLAWRWLIWHYLPAWERDAMAGI